GHIAFEEQGEGGFGYDKVFVPEGYDESFASLGVDVKNKIGHRARALARLEELLDGEN
ncbi:MAG: non-canonical purine NTP pyrophosphatase, partial [Firmicutes bacterium]|nr:non-canonical purine NTP pyrophosphatase [Bacillota bacterium]